jgi:hypothetical protein
MYYECINPCAKQYFSNPSYKGYEVRVKTRKKTFSILLDNEVIAGPAYEYQLLPKLNELGLK